MRSPLPLLLAWLFKPPEHHWIILLNHSLVFLLFSSASPFVTTQLLTSQPSPQETTDSHPKGGIHHILQRLPLRNHCQQYHAINCNSDFPLFRASYPSISYHAFRGFLTHNLDFRIYTPSPLLLYPILQLSHTIFSVFPFSTMNLLPANITGL